MDYKGMLRRGVRHYRREGVVSLLHEFPRYVSQQAIRRNSIDSSELKNIAESRGTIWYTGSEESIQIPPPDHSGFRSALADYPKQFEPEQGFVCELRNCDLRGRYAAAIYNRKHLILETTRRRFSRKDFVSVEKTALELLLPTRTNMINGPVFSIVCPDPSYYHWLIEYLPKLRYLEKYQESTGRKPTLLVESNPRDFVSESLELAGYGPNRWIEWDRNPRAVDRLVIPIHRPHKFTHNDPMNSPHAPAKGDYIWLREHMRSQLGDYCPDTNTNERIFISRQQANRGRKIINQDQIKQLLDSYGFNTYVLEEYSIPEQIKIFENAEVVVGSHGAGLANVIFADNPTVVELFPETRLRPHIYFLSSILGLRHETMVTEAEEDNLLVDPEQLQSLLERLNL